MLQVVESAIMDQFVTFRKRVYNAENEVTVFSLIVPKLQKMWSSSFIQSYSSKKSFILTQQD